MRSLVNKAYDQVLETGKIHLFKSYKPMFKDGEQQRDFLYVKDAVEMTIHLAVTRTANGLFNVGSGDGANLGRSRQRRVCSSFPARSDRVYRDAGGDPRKVPVLHPSQHRENKSHWLSGSASSLSSKRSPITCRIISSLIGTWSSKSPLQSSSSSFSTLGSGRRSAFRFSVTEPCAAGTSNAER